MLDIGMSSFLGKQMLESWKVHLSQQVWSNQEVYEPKATLDTPGSGVWYAELRVYVSMANKKDLDGYIYKNVAPPITPVGIKYQNTSVTSPGCAEVC